MSELCPFYGTNNIATNAPCPVCGDMWPIPAEFGEEPESRCVAWGKLVDAALGETSDV